MSITAESSGPVPTSETYRDAYTLTQPQSRRGQSPTEMLNDGDLDESTTGTTYSSPKPSSSSRKGISFGYVHVRRHKVTMGDNPAVSSGVPLALDWDYVSSERFELPPENDDSEGSVTSRKAEKISKEEREAILRKQGYTDESFEQVESEIAVIKSPSGRTRGRKYHVDPSKLESFRKITETSLKDIRDELRQERLQQASLKTRSPSRKLQRFVSLRKSDIAVPGPGIF